MSTQTDDKTVKTDKNSTNDVSSFFETCRI